ncbi:unnamed protein product [Moneuplotes crassus]|uniref:Uncharacterized protein n=1 Tax=Euplotes crassus TaxID=5936 RepID=A0AAD1UJR0_EUPCR|nr:unnamed protein product [Moneuplotes crassus]
MLHYLFSLFVKRYLPMSCSSLTHGKANGATICNVKSLRYFFVENVYIILKVISPFYVKNNFIKIYQIDLCP